MTIIIYLSLFLLASLPIKIIIEWLNPISAPSRNLTIKVGSSIATFGINHLLYFLLGYAGSKIIEQLFFYEDPLFNYGAIMIITSGYFWSVFQKFKPAGNISSFILGILTFFSSHYLWFFTLSSLVLILLANHISMGLFLALLLSYLGIIFFDIENQFIIIHTIIIILFILRKNSALIDFFSSNPTTLLTHFQNRNSN